MTEELDGLTAPTPVPDVEYDGLLAQWDHESGVFQLRRPFLSPTEIRKLFGVVVEYELE